MKDANLEDGIKLIGDRPILQIGPIGPRSAYLLAFFTNAGIRLWAGCFFETIEDFEDRLKTEYGDNKHAREYRAALELVRSHSELWGGANELR